MHTFWDKCSPGMWTIWGDVVSANTRFEHKCDLFLWSYLKEKLFKNSSHTLVELGDRIIYVVNAISCHILMELYWNLYKNVFNRILLLTAAILGTLFLKLDEFKMVWTDQFKYKVNKSVYRPTYFTLVIIGPQNCVVVVRSAAPCILMK